MAHRALSKIDLRIRVSGTKLHPDQLRTVIETGTVSNIVVGGVGEKAND